MTITMKIPYKSQAHVIRATTLTIVCLAMTACGTTSQIAPYQTFAQAGIVIADSVPPLLDESIALTIELDSQQLTDFRELVEDKKARGAKLKDSNDLIKDRIEVFRDLRQHARVMRSYFVTLQSLATSDAAGGIQSSTNGLVQELGQLQQQVMGSSGPISAGVAKALPLAANMAVTSYQYKALSDELERNGATIERELAFVEAALVTMRDIAAGEFAAIQAAKQRDEIDLPYLSDSNASLPANWNAKRQQLFEAQLKMSSLDNASNAARDLRLSFIALTEGRLSPDAANEVLANAVTILTILDKN